MFYGLSDDFATSSNAGFSSDGFSSGFSSKSEPSLRQVAPDADPGEAFEAETRSLASSIPYYYTQV